MKKPLLIPLLIAVTVFTSGFSVKEWRSSLYDSVKVEAEKSFSALFNRKVTIESAGGIIVGQIELKEMKIPELGRAEKVVLNYNPIKYAFAKGDMVPALTKITVVNGDFEVVRDRRGRLNVLSLFQAKGNEAAAPPAFLGRLALKHCKVSYIDHLGFRPSPQRFEVAGTDVNGVVDLRNKDKVKFSLAGKIPEPSNAKGTFDLKTGNFELTASASNLELKQWLNYTVPVPELTALGGKGDVFLQLAPSKTKGWPVSLTAKFTLYDASVRFQTYEFRRVSGKLFLADENLAFTGLKAEMNGVPFTASGRLYNFSKLQAEGTVAVSQGVLYGQKFSGSASFSLKNDLLSLETKDLSLYQGASSAQLNIMLKEPPQLKLFVKFSNINLAALAQNAPGIEGRANGTIELAGPVDDLAGKYSAFLSRALFLGQPMEKVSSSLKIQKGDFYIENFLASAGNVTFSARGKIGKDLSFDLRTDANGFNLSGKGAFGAMRATLSRFQGEMHGKIGEKKSFFASGEALLVNGKIGDQTLERAQGKISIGGGQIKIEETFLQSGRSTLEASGQTGLGVPTRLKISGERVDLEDLKILNYLLPPEAQDPKGTATLEVEITGSLSRETEITSLDPLLDLTAKGDLSISQGIFAEIPISWAHLNLVWEDRSLFLSNCQVNFPDSTVTLDLKYLKDGTLNGSLKGITDLSLLRNLTSKYGKIEGLAGFNLQISGRAEEPNVGASLWVNRFLLNEVYFDHISGSFNYYRGRLTLPEPLLFRKGTDLYSLAGNADFDNENPEESDLNLDFKILRADLGSSYRLVDKLEGEFMRRFPPPAEEGGRLKVNLPHLGITAESLRLYSANGEKRFLLKNWGSIRQEFEKKLAAMPEENIGGDLAGELRLQGKVSNLSGNFSGGISKGFFRDFRFDEFVAAATLKNQQIKFEKAVLQKGKGNISVRGDYNFNGQIFLHVVANNLPLDILQIVFPGKEFKGNFNMNAGLDGLLANPRVVIAASGRNITVAGVSFDDAIFSVTKKNGHLYLHEISLLQEGVLSSVYGSVLLSHPGRIDLEANLKGNTIGLLNLFTDEVKWNKGSSLLSVRITGTLDEPEINGKVEIDDGALYIRALDSDLQQLQGSAAIKNNLLRIEALTGIWKGIKTKGLPNPLGLAGIIDLSKVLARKNMVDLDLAFSPTRLYLAFPNLYVGVLDLKELSLRGPLYFDLSQGPRLIGKIDMDEAVITLSPSAAQRGKVFPLNFDLEASLVKNVYATMGDIATLNLSNILMNLEIAGGLKISGDLENPSLLGKIAIKRGTVNIFNREFTLLSPEIQKRYFPYDSEKVQENIALFTGEKGPAGILPYLNVTSNVMVENTEKDAGGQYVKKMVNVLARLKGTIGAKEEDRGLKISLSSFTEDKTKSPPEMMPAAYSEQDLKVMLLPDFIKSLAGIGRPEEISQEKVDTNAVVADYLSSRVQTLLFRGLERQIEQKLGLESLTLEYNLGPKFREAMGVKDVKGFETEKPAWTVGFVKGLTERLYVDVRYSQGIESTTGSGANTNFNYQLTYKLSPIWSIIYYREPLSISDITTGYQKITLKAGFYLW